VWIVGAVIQIVNPDVIIFGGGVGTSSERFIARVEEATRSFVMPSLRGRCRFVISQLREQVVAQGAALLAAQRCGWNAAASVPYLMGNVIVNVVP
jgi:predicted NBD/HSP70 family sugar kinase